MTKDAGIVVALPPDLKEWVDVQAEDIGVNAAIWIRMLVFAARKGRAGVPVSPVPARASEPRPQRFEEEFSVEPRYGSADPDLWRGAVDDDTETDASVDVDAIIASRVAEADAAGLTAPPQQPYEAFGPPPGANVTPIGGARALRRPAVPYSPAKQPSHIDRLY